MRRILATAGFALLLVGCSSGSHVESGPSTFEPSKAQRACTRDSECVVADIECDSCCPGGAAVNSKSLEAFKSQHKKTCSSRRTKQRSDCTCVMAPVRCLNRLCTWDYQGPDPGSL